MVGYGLADRWSQRGISSGRSRLVEGKGVRDRRGGRESHWHMRSICWITGDVGIEAPRYQDELLRGC